MNRKKLLALLLCLALCVSLIPAGFAEDIELVDTEEIAIVDTPDRTEPGPDAEIQLTKIAGGTCGNDVTWSLYEGGLLSLSGAGATDDYYTTHPGFYSYRDDITSAVILEGVTKLGAYLFYGMSQLDSVTLGIDVISVGDLCFGSCENLTTIRFNGKAPSLGTDPFIDVDATAYYLPVESYGWTSSVMNQYGGTIYWVLDNKVGDQVVWSLNSSGVLSLSGSGETWDYPTGVQSFFPVRRQCSSLVINEGITKLGISALSDLSRITSVSLPSSLVTISDHVFTNNNELLSVTIPAKVKEIGRFAFANCFALEEIRFRGNAPSFGDNCFSTLTTTAWYPEGNTTWTEDVRQNYEGKITWQSYNAGYIVTVTDYTKGAADCSLANGGAYSGMQNFTVSSPDDKAVLVLMKNGSRYTALNCTTIGKTHSYAVNLNGALELVLVYAGDVNLDGQVKSLDGTMIKRASLGTYELDALKTLVSDINGDGVIKSLEGTMVIRASLGTYTLPW